MPAPEQARNAPATAGETPTPHSGRDEALLLLASLEQHSEHPLGRALVESVKQSENSLFAASEVTVHKGKGITGRIEGREVFVGNRRLAADLGISVEDLAVERAVRA